jgi:hypothetical protein
LGLIPGEIHPLGQEKRIVTLTAASGWYILVPNEIIPVKTGTTEAIPLMIWLP